MGRLRLWLQVGCVVAAFTALWTQFDRVVSVEPGEYWDLFRAHPGAKTSDLRWDASADQKFTLRELRELQAAIDTHDHSECLKWFEWDARLHGDSDQ